jgi:hypothetical protein
VGDITFAVLHLGDHNLIGGAREYRDEESLSAMQSEITSSFNRSDIANTIDLIDKHFGSHSYSLWHLFRDEKRKVMKQVIKSTLQELEKSYRTIYENHFPILKAMRDMKIPVPQALAMPVSFVLNIDLKRLLKGKVPELEKIKKTAEEFSLYALVPDKTDLSFVASNKINEMIQDLFLDPENLKLLESIKDLLQILSLLDLELNLWKSQNNVFFLTEKFMAVMKERVEKGDKKAEKWLEFVHSVGDFLGVKNI